MEPPNCTRFHMVSCILRYRSRAILRSHIQRWRVGASGAELIWFVQFICMVARHTRRKVEFPQLGTGSLHRPGPSCGEIWNTCFNRTRTHTHIYIYIYTHTYLSFNVSDWLGRDTLRSERLRFRLQSWCHVGSRLWALFRSRHWVIRSSSSKMA